MIRVLVIGPDAATLSSRLRPAAPGADFESARLPAAAVRAFEKSPADAVILCGSQMARERLEDVVAALRERPLGRLVPCLWVGEGECEQTDASTTDDAEPPAVVALLAELIGVDPDELSVAPMARPTADAPLTEQMVERKLRQVRHETYYDVLEVEQDVSENTLRDAFARVAERFASHRVPAELEERFGEELAEVCDGIEDAFAVLSNAKLRAAYANHRGSARSRE